MRIAPHGALVLAGIAGHRLQCTAVLHAFVESGGVELRQLDTDVARRGGEGLEGARVHRVISGASDPFLNAHWENSVAVIHSEGEVDFRAADLTMIGEIARQARLTVVTVDLPGAVAADAAALGMALSGTGIDPTFVGCARRGVLRSVPDVVVAIVEHPSTPALTRAPDEFTVVALVTAFNEEDIVVPTLTYLIEQGIQVHLVDNWSTDRTAELAKPFLGKGLLAIEQFPPDGPTGTYDWGELLGHVEAVAASLEANWFIQHDVDERRIAPWPGLTLRDGLYNADLRGFSAIDHSHIDFHPTDNSYVPGTDPEGHFHWFAPPIDVHDNAHVKAWKKLGVPVDLASSGGHEARFPGRQVFPYNFLLKHYPFRSQQHGEKKVLNERRPRWNQEERKKGWHFGYDHIRHGHSFLKREEHLYRFDDDFTTTYLLERLAPIAKPVEQLSYPRQLRRRLVPFLRRIGLLSASVWVQRRYRVLRRRDVASGRK